MRSQRAGSSRGHTRRSFHTESSASAAAAMSCTANTHASAEVEPEEAGGGQHRHQERDAPVGTAWRHSTPRWYAAYTVSGVGEVAPGIHRLGDWFVNWYLVEDEGEITIVDAGDRDHWDLRVQGLDELGIDRGKVQRAAADAR